MNESITAYTLLALIATGVGSLVVGALIGWVVRQYQDEQEISLLRDNIKAKNKESRSRVAELEEISARLHKHKKTQGLHTKKDKFIKDLLFKQSESIKQIDQQRNLLKQQVSEHLKTKTQIIQIQKQLSKSNNRVRNLMQNQDRLRDSALSAMKTVNELNDEKAKVSEKTHRMLKQLSENHTKAMAQLKESMNVEANATRTRDNGSEQVVQTATQIKNPRRINAPNVTMQVQSAPAKQLKTALLTAQVEPTATTTTQQTDSQQRSAHPTIKLRVVDPSELQATKAKITMPEETDNSQMSLSRITDEKITESMSNKLARSKAATSAKKAPRQPKIEKTADDLKLIKGIGPAIETALNKIGIECFEQIAKLNKKQIREVDEKLGSFAGRITRDNWVASAQKLTN